MHRGTRRLRRNSLIVWGGLLLIIGFVVIKQGWLLKIYDSPISRAVYKVGQQFGLINIDFPQESVKKPETNQGIKKDVLGLNNGVPSSYYIYDEEAKNPEDQEATGATGENHTVVHVGDDTYELPVAKCERGVTRYYVVKAEYIDNGMVLPASYVGFDKTTPEFVDPRKDKTAAIYQAPHRDDELSMSYVNRSLRKSVTYQNSREYATSFTPYKNAALGSQRAAIKRAAIAYRTPGERAYGKLREALYNALAKAKTIQEFRISLRFEGVDPKAQGVMRHNCNLQTRPITLGAPNASKALKYANAYNLPLAAAVVDSSVLSRLRNPGSKEQPVVFSNVQGRSLDTEDDRYYRYLLTTIGYDITMQADLPEDAGAIYKAAIKIEHWFNALRKRLDKANRAVPLVAKGRNYVYVPMVCKCVGEAKKFDYRTLTIKDDKYCYINRRTGAKVCKPAGTKYSCRLDFGRPVLGNVDTPISKDATRPYLNRGKNFKVKEAIRPPGDELQNSKFTWVELAYINCRVDKNKARQILEKASREGERSDYGRELIWVEEEKGYKERIEVLHDKFCEKHGDDDKERAKRLLSTWLSNAGYFVQTVYFKLKRAETRGSGGGGSFGYGCSSDLVSGEGIDDIVGSGDKVAAVQVLSFMDPRINTEMLLERFKGGPGPKKAGKDAYDEQLSLLEKFINFKAYVHERYNWDIVGYVLTLEGDEYKLELRDISDIAGDANIAFPGTRAVYPLKF